MREKEELTEENLTAFDKATLEMLSGMLHHFVSFRLNNIHIDDKTFSKLAMPGISSVLCQSLSLLDQEEIASAWEIAKRFVGEKIDNGLKTERMLWAEVAKQSAEQERNGATIN